MINIEDYMGFIMHIAKQTHGQDYPWMSLDDAFQEGCMGFLGAVTHYKPEKGVFLSYAATRIRGAIIDAKRREFGRRKLMIYEPLDKLVDASDFRPAVEQKVCLEAVLSAEEKDFVERYFVKQDRFKEIAADRQCSEAHLSHKKKAILGKINKEVT